MLKGIISQNVYQRHSNTVKTKQGHRFGADSKIVRLRTKGNYMKYALGLAMLVSMGAMGALAQGVDAFTADKNTSVQILDDEAYALVQTIKGYAEGAKGIQYINTFDRKKGAEIKVRLDRIVLDDPSRIVFPSEGKVAVVGECTQVDMNNINEETKLPAEGDKYELWFLLQRGNIVNSRVLEVIVKSVNGNPMYEWTKNESGVWTATLVPDPAE